MNITFLIGNGFDLNLGLNTTYSDFVYEYKSTDSSNQNIENFKKHIDEHEELWSNAELELGQYTNEFNKGEANKLSECHSDFCQHLVNYLKREEDRVDFEEHTSEIISAISKIEEIADCFNSQEKKTIENVFTKYIGENRYFKFVNFNYTTTLDKCIDIACNNPETLKSHTYGTKYKHQITDNIHVHGTLDKEMVFAVNDETQIAKLDVFDCEYGEIYKNSFIKKKANDSYGENTDSIAYNIINSSTIIYVYGMSIGDTDKMWWDRVCNWLSSSTDRHLIVHKFKMPPKGLLQIEYKIDEEKYKDLILSKSKLNDKNKEVVKKQIHVTDYNIFSDIYKIANPKTISTIVKEKELVLK